MWYGLNKEWKKYSLDYEIKNVCREAVTDWKYAEENRKKGGEIKI